MPLDSPQSLTDELLLDAYSRGVVSVVDRVGPAVVRVERLAVNGRPGGGTGSGVVIAGDGLVFTLPPRSRARAVARPIRSALSMRISASAPSTAKPSTESTRGQEPHECCCP